MISLRGCVHRSANTCFRMSYSLCVFVLNVCSQIPEDVLPQPLHL